MQYERYDGGVEHGKEVSSRHMEGGGCRMEKEHMTKASIFFFFVLASRDKADLA